MHSKVTVLVAAGGATWEAIALQQLESRPSTSTLKRCVDLADLLGSAATGQAEVALVSAELPGLDADSVSHLTRCGLPVVAVLNDTDRATSGTERLHRQGVRRVVPASSLDQLEQILLDLTAEVASESAPDPAAPVTGTPPAPTGPADDTVPGRTVAVWGPRGAPGRTTIAVGVAAELAARGTEALLVDADAYGGTVAQHLGVLDQVSGLLAAARLANAGQLDLGRLSGIARQVSPSFRVLTGLPRADRWPEVRESAFHQLLELAGSLGRFVVLDTASCLEQEGGAVFAGPAPQRNQMTLTALERADEILVVGSADPVGLARLARGLVELLEAVPGPLVRIAVNRTRSTLGWGERDVRAMIEGFVTPESVHFLPDDRSAVDRALVSGKSLTELGESPLRRGIADLVDAVVGVARGPRRSPNRLRRAHAPNRR